jgi:2-C-methyl-D-erythritol 4-phosphate cytidylyltransferase
MKLSVIITAGGIGKRFTSSVPKQFLPLLGIPVLMRTIDVFYQWNSTAQLILTLPADWVDYWQKLMSDHEFNVPHSVVVGGQERYHSIKNALDSCQGDYVMIHDGVRPLVNEETLNRCISDIENKKAVVPVVVLKESIRAVNDNSSVSLDRKDYVRVQTPQCFSLGVLKKSYNGEYKEVFTDDASVVEAGGNRIYMEQGNAENIKITTHLDFELAEAILKLNK